MLPFALHSPAPAFARAGTLFRPMMAQFAAAPGGMMRFIAGSSLVVGLRCTRWGHYFVKSGDTPLQQVGGFIVIRNSTVKQFSAAFKSRACSHLRTCSAGKD